MLPSLSLSLCLSLSLSLAMLWRLKQKVRKYNKDYEESVVHCRDNPSLYEDVDEEEEDEEEEEGDSEDDEYVKKGM